MLELQNNKAVPVEWARRPRHQDAGAFRGPTSAVDVEFAMGKAKTCFVYDHQRLQTHKSSMCMFITSLFESPKGGEVGCLFLVYCPKNGTFTPIK